MTELSVLLIPLLLTPFACAADLPEGPGRDLPIRTCTGCHKAESFAAYRFTKEDYHSIVYRMAERGAQATDKELDQIAEYLAKNFLKVEDPTKVNLNKATANEMQTRLGLPAKEAEAIVAYRERNGDFHAIGDLYVIYGVDGKKLEAVKDRVSF